ncbi:MAG: hypothetical protein LC107_14305 [Chitinophagales bacterium]|nr:hypothetical protein [Chitinophagales bacterium]MCZ2101298.1 hypothetical protein [Chitinophagales bacterium]MCZ2101829.1 hypothetical protein [Chitinophagales bacterium]MCZ2101834.1 hypothetical protein [Chitinophagales bacterium]MCZ2102107.1 hypothetical protein [Chitinophagales bacterium]
MTKKETKQIGKRKQNTCIVGKGIYMPEGNLNIKIATKKRKLTYKKPR